MTAEHAAHVRQVWRRRFAKYSRWLHIYVSMASFAIVFFFAVTGITLNHAEWFGGAERTSSTKGTLKADWTRAGTKEVAKLEIVEALRDAQHITGAVADFRVDDEQVSITFKSAGYSADVVIDRATGKYDATESRLGFVAIVNDLHKGRDTGGVWKSLIDISAALLAFISLTGLMLLYFIHKHRFAGFILLALGGAASCIAYVAWVP